MDRNLYLSSFVLVSLVALRKESVDRNMLFLSFRPVAGSSLSARRAWIEIVISAMTSQISVVALRKESVDRNPLAVVVVLTLIRRSPQGERG